MLTIPILRIVSLRERSTHNLSKAMWFVSGRAGIRTVTPEAFALCP